MPRAKLRHLQRQRLLMLETIERVTAPDPTWSVIWLHGLGADGGDFVPMVPELLRPRWPRLRFVFPHAPVRPVTLNGGMRMRAWYDIRDLELNSRADETGVRESIAQIDELIAREGERGIAPGRIVLAGFSQGGAIALTCALRREQALGGVLALSTYLPLGNANASEATTAGKSTPVFMAHGTQDPMVRPEWGAASRDALRTLGVPVEWHTYPMPHSVCAEEVADIAQWLTARVATG
jgi:phospholipase/carboxylesterase